MNAIFSRASRYFLDLGFYPEQIEFGTGLPLKRLIWSIAAYLLLFMGLLSQQCIDLSKVPLAVSVSNLRWTVLAASAVVAIALFPPFTHWFNKKRQKPSWEHVLWAFSFGFFVNLSSNFIWKKLL
jgi:hypothetical protein